MEICQDHWYELKNAIRQRGMWKLVCKGTDVKAIQSTSELASESTFDPLESACRMIALQARMAFGDGWENHKRCPLCEVEENLGTAQEWIDVNADILLRLCRSRHWIGREE